MIVEIDTNFSSWLLTADDEAQEPFLLISREIPISTNTRAEDPVAKPSTRHAVGARGMRIWYGGTWSGGSL